jgi:hypothetical protein
MAMRRLQKIVQGSAMVTLCTFFAATAFGSLTANVANFGFESPLLSAGGFTVNSVDSWVGIQPSGTQFGTFNPVNGVSVNSVPDGEYVAYLNANPSTADFVSIMQDLTANGLGNGPILGLTTYTLTVDIGARLEGSVGLPTTFGIELIDSTASSVIASNSLCTAPTAGNFVACSVSFDSAVFGTVGDNLGIALFAGGPQVVGFPQVLFDNVLVDFSSDVPEPGSVALVVIGIAALSVKSRLQRKRS